MISKSAGRVAQQLTGKRTSISGPRSRRHSCLAGGLLSLVLALSGTTTITNHACLLIARPVHASLATSSPSAARQAAPTVGPACRAGLAASAARAQRLGRREELMVAVQGLPHCCSDGGFSGCRARAWRERARLLTMKLNFVDCQCDKQLRQPSAGFLLPPLSNSCVCHCIHCALLFSGSSRLPISRWTG